ncbi:hypothetical protein NDU88_006855 [Pleurodeles waltl]|uniref:Uncharacterized protein n=1 Tax=Pleurodeles waltl TaxID=8319 RepID=A0AAV7NV94_PLEWA|nr:hypothetical protein NDU88_006855 [Pleurodeles waltl]
MSGGLGRLPVSASLHTCAGIASLSPVPFWGLVSTLRSRRPWLLQLALWSRASRAGSAGSGSPLPYLPRPRDQGSEALRGSWLPRCWRCTAGCQRGLLVAGLGCRLLLGCGSVLVRGLLPPSYCRWLPVFVATSAWCRGLGPTVDPWSFGLRCRTLVPAGAHLATGSGYGLLRDAESLLLGAPLIFLLCASSLGYPLTPFPPEVPCETYRGGATFIFIFYMPNLFLSGCNLFGPHGALMLLPCGAVGGAEWSGALRS